MVGYFRALMPNSAQGHSSRAPSRKTTPFFLFVVVSFGITAFTESLRRGVTKLNRLEKVRAVQLREFGHRSLRWSVNQAAFCTPLYEIISPSCIAIAARSPRRPTTEKTSRLSVCSTSLSVCPEGSTI